MGWALSGLPWLSAAQRALIVVDAGEAALWRGDADAVERWRAALDPGTTRDAEVDAQLDRAAWLFEAADDAWVLARTPRLRPVLDVLRAGLGVPPILRSLPWRRFMVSVREGGWTLAELRGVLEREAPAFVDLLALVEPLPAQLSSAPAHPAIESWLTMENSALAAHPMCGRALPRFVTVVLVIFVIAAPLVPDSLFEALALYGLVVAAVTYPVFMMAYERMFYQRVVRPRVVRFMRAHGVDRSSLLASIDRASGVDVVAALAPQIASDTELDFDGASLRVAA
ncbi:MAG: hypothetical protein KC583_20875 [Myxococcales bacterium]|nr:hypothetical protein [Myxococcales bacterium]